MKKYYLLTLFMVACGGKHALRVDDCSMAQDSLLCLSYSGKRYEVPYDDRAVGFKCLSLPDYEEYYDNCLSGRGVKDTKSCTIEQNMTLSCKDGSVHPVPTLNYICTPSRHFARLQRRCE